MGRYAQRRRRATPSDSPATPPPVLVTITNVISTGTNTYQVVFSDVITYDGSGNLQFLTIDGAGIDTVTGVGASTLDVFTSSADGPGLLWECLVQPPQISESLALPVSGTTL